MGQYRDCAHSVVAQLEEQLIDNQQVAGSIPADATIFRLAGSRKIYHEPVSIADYRRKRKQLSKK